MRRLLVAAALLLATAPVGGAHEADPGVVVVLDEAGVTDPGVTVQVAVGPAAQLVVANTSPTPLLVFAETGEPLFRISAAGAYANTGSASWQPSNSPYGGPGQAGAERWALVSREPSWGWFDHRLHPARVAPTDEQRGGGTVVRLAEWSVPVRYGDRDAAVRGHVEYRPVRGRLVTRLTGGPPPGTEVVVLDGRVPGLFLRATRPVLVTGERGEAFARVGPSGAEVNLRSPTYVADARLRGRRPVLPTATADAEWHRVGTAPTLSWLDRRLAYRDGEPPPEVTRSRRPRVLVEWRVPTDLGDLVGVTEWVPFEPAGERPLWPWLAGAAGLAAAVLGVRLARR